MSTMIFLRKMVDVPLSKREEIGRMLSLQEGDLSNILSVEVQLETFDGSDFADFLDMYLNGNENSALDYEFDIERAQNYIEAVHNYRKNSPDFLGNFKDDACKLCEILTNQLAWGTDNFKISIWY